MPSRAQGTPFGRYLLGARLATGGMGEVYVAVQLGLGDFQKPLALKLLLPHLSEDPHAVEMFLREANLAVRMHHPNVVQILDVGVQDGRYFIAMELVRGVTLSQLLRSLSEAQAQLPAPLIAYVAHELLEGLQHAHELVDDEGRALEIIHRDVSPQNVLLSLTGEVKLADFGIAKARDSERHTRTGVLKGKFEYLAPEQFDGHAANRKTDVFAAAVTLYQMATLRSPFRRPTEGATMRAVMTEPLTPLSSERPELADLDEVLARATARDPARRTGSAVELQRAIPPPSLANPAHELAKLIAAHCQAAVAALEAHTAQSEQLGREHTRGATDEGKLAPAPSRRRWWPALLPLALVPPAAWWWTTSERPPPSKGETSEVNVAPAAEEPPPLAPTAIAVTPLEPEKPRPLPAQVQRKEGKWKGGSIGYLTVDAEPWATVYVRNRKIGDTPLYRFPIEEGEVSVMLTSPDTGKSITRKVKVLRAREASLKEDLR